MSPPLKNLFATILFVDFFREWKWEKREPCLVEDRFSLANRALQLLITDRTTWLGRVSEIPQT